MKCETEKKLTNDFCEKKVSFRLGNVMMYYLFYIIKQDIHIYNKYEN